MKKEYISYILIGIVVLALIFYKFSMAGTIYSGYTCSNLPYSCAVCKTVYSGLTSEAVCCGAGQHVTSLNTCQNDCNADCSCGTNTCQGSTCSDKCGGTCQGQKVCSGGGGGGGGGGGCSADCAGKSCGSDGCGGSCGTCSGSDTCSSGQCVSSCIWVVGPCPENNPNCLCSLKDAGASCDSNYMCKSNLCSDGVCSIAQCTVGQEKCCDSTTSCSVNHAILECSSSGFWYQDLIVGKCGYSLGGTCTPNCDCASTVCTGNNCYNGCGGACAGTMSCDSPITQYCGDGTCNGDENCSTCSQDCGVCPVCGDGTCNGNEDCSTCSTDCGLCAWCKSATQCCADTTQTYCAGTNVCGSTGFCDNYINHFQTSCVNNICCPNVGDILDFKCANSSGIDCCCSPNTPFLTSNGCSDKISNESVNYYTKNSECSIEGNYCKGFSYIECTGNNFIYSQTNNTILVGKCGVECINNQVKTGYICSNYKWIINQDNESNDNNSNNNESNLADYYRIKDNSCVLSQLTPDEVTDLDYSNLDDCNYYLGLNNITVCSMLAKQCSDGSSVSENSSNNCEFDACPADKTFFQKYWYIIILGAIGIGWYLYKSKGKRK